MLSGVCADSSLQRIDEDVCENLFDDKTRAGCFQLQAQIRELRKEVDRLWDDRREHNALVMEGLQSKFTQELVASAMDSAVSKSVAALVKAGHAVLESKLQSAMESKVQNVMASQAEDLKAMASKLQTAMESKVQNAIDGQAQELKDLQDQLDKFVSNADRYFCEVSHLCEGFRAAHSVKEITAIDEEQDISTMRHQLLNVMPSIPMPEPSPRKNVKDPCMDGLDDFQDTCDDLKKILDGVQRQDAQGNACSSLGEQLQSASDKLNVLVDGARHRSEKTKAVGEQQQVATLQDQPHTADLVNAAAPIAVSHQTLEAQLGRIDAAIARKQSSGQSETSQEAAALPSGTLPTQPLGQMLEDKQLTDAQLAKQARAENTLAELEASNAFIHDEVAPVVENVLVSAVTNETEAVATKIANELRRLLAEAGVESSTDRPAPSSGSAKDDSHSISQTMSNSSRGRQLTGPHPSNSPRREARSLPKQPLLSHTQGPARGSHGAPVFCTAAGSSAAGSTHFSPQVPMSSSNTMTLMANAAPPLADKVGIIRVDKSASSGPTGIASRTAPSDKLLAARAESPLWPRTLRGRSQPAPAASVSADVHRRLSQAYSPRRAAGN